MQCRAAHWLAWMTLACAWQAAPAATSEGDARRFLSQASFGPTDASVASLMASDRRTWLQAQFAVPASGYGGFVYLSPDSNVGCPTGAAATCTRDNYTLFPLQLKFWRNALTGSDQLRQRVALALSEILVTSGQQIRQPYAMAAYQRIFLDHAFGNFRDILRQVTVSPAMGAYLNMVNNDKPNPARGIEPNENYAREVLQLFSIGVWELNSDGSRRLDAAGAPIPSYDQAVVEGFAHAFTGWTYAPRPGAGSAFPNPANFESPMVAFAAHHDLSAKTLLKGVQLPAGQSAEADLTAALDNIFQHPNVGPFIGRQLIQQLVTSNPSPAYVARVAAAFNGAGLVNGGSGGARGDMRAVITAVLLDSEAALPAAPSRFGKLREPILQLAHLFRALGGRSDGVWLQAVVSALGEPVFSPATVFGFFPPAFDLPGNPTLDGPAFGIYGANAALTLSGVMVTALSSSGVAADASVPGSTGSRIDLIPWQALAADPAKLINAIDRVLLAGRMSADLRSTLQSAVLTQPASNPLGRARAALFVAVMSPEYLAEH